MWRFGKASATSEGAAVQLRQCPKKVRVATFNHEQGLRLKKTNPRYAHKKQNGDRRHDCRITRYNHIAKQLINGERPARRKKLRSVVELEISGFVCLSQTNSANKRMIERLVVCRAVITTTKRTASHWLSPHSAAEVYQSERCFIIPALSISAA